MSCPNTRCRGGERRAIAPSYFECVSPIEAFAYGTDGNVVSFLEPCGFRYYDGPAPGTNSPVCGCRTYAVRSCTTCSAPLCGDCSVNHDGVWLCSPCRQVKQQMAAKREHDKRQALLAPYLALPPIDTATMTAYLDGRIDDIHDGITHQAWDWTNRDIVEVVKSIWPEEDFLWCDYHWEGADSSGLGSERLDECGRILERDITDIDRSRHGTVTDTIEQAMPDERFNAPYRVDPRRDSRPVVIERLGELRDAIAQEKVPRVNHYARYQRRKNLLAWVKPILIIAAVLAFLIWANS